MQQLLGRSWTDSVSLHAVPSSAMTMTLLFALLMHVAVTLVQKFIRRTIKIAELEREWVSADAALEKILSGSSADSEGPESRSLSSLLSQFGAPPFEPVELTTLHLLASDTPLVVSESEPTLAMGTIAILCPPRGVKPCEVGVSRVPQAPAIVLADAAPFCFEVTISDGDHSSDASVRAAAESLAQRLPVSGSPSHLRRHPSLA